MINAPWLDAEGRFYIIIKKYLSILYGLKRLCVVEHKDDYVSYPHGNAFNSAALAENEKKNNHKNQC